jgi:hypothetical protein
MQNVFSTRGLPIHQVLPGGSCIERERRRRLRINIIYT